MSEAIFLANGEAKILPPFEVSATASVACAAGAAFVSSTAGALAVAAPPAVKLSATPEMSVPAGPMIANKLSTGAVLPS
ncbi:hypothetical protein D3C87_801020 [compost metagenome]